MSIIWRTFRLAKLNLTVLTCSTLHEWKEFAPELTMLERIPIEVLRIILSNVRAKSDLFNLCLTSKKLHSLALPKLHESLTMFTGDYTLEPLVLPGSGPTGELVWKYLRKLTISGLGWADTLDRCHHHNPAYYSDRAVSPGKDPIEMMEKDFFPSINALPDHQLREFRYI